MKIIIWLLLFIPFITLAQQKNIDHISVHMYAAGVNEFFINIFRYENNIKIVYKFLDSTSSAIFPIYQEKSIAFSKLKNKDSLATAKIELDSLWVTNSFFSSDSLLFATCQNKEYCDLISIMKTAQDSSFINQTPNILIADGFSVSVIIESLDHYLKIGAHSPDEKSYPLLTKFLTETIKVGLNTHCASLLNSKVTYIRS